MSNDRRMKCNRYPTIMMKLCYSATHNGNVFMIKAKSVDYLTLVGTNCNRANAQVNGIGELI